MPLPKLGDAQISWIIEQVAQYNQQQRQNHGGTALTLDPNQKLAVQPFSGVFAGLDARDSSRRGKGPQPTFLCSTRPHEIRNCRLLFHAVVTVSLRPLAEIRL